MSLPRSRISFNWFASIVSRSSSSLILGQTFGQWLRRVFNAMIWRLRHSSSAFGAVV